MARTDFRTPRLYVCRPSPRAPSSRSILRADKLSRQCAAARRGRSRSPVQRPRRRIRRVARSGLAQGGFAHRRRANPAAGGAAGRRLSVRAAQARSARLYGAEGGRDGRAPAAADHHPPHPGRAPQFRAPERQRDRGLRAMRRDLDARGRRAGAARAGARRMAGRNGCSSSATRRRDRGARSMRCANARATAASAS